MKTVKLKTNYNHNRRIKIVSHLTMQIKRQKIKGNQKQRTATSLNH